MHSCDVIYYTGDADCWCEDCALERFGSLTGKDSEGNELGAAFAGEESDSPVHCAGCGTFLEGQGLTAEGCAYVLEACVRDFKSGRLESPALTVWAPAFFECSDINERGDRFETVEGAYWACADYHAGQSSRGYRHLSKLGRHFRPGPFRNSASLEGPAFAAYVRTAAGLL